MFQNKNFTYTENEFREAVEASVSIRQTLIKLKLAPKGGNYRIFKKVVDYLKIDLSHFKGQGANKGTKFGPKRPLSSYLSNEYPILSSRLKKRLISENIFEPKCSWCENTKWLDKPIPLELDHIDGNHLNNNLDNLRLLCPNCHALTPTYRGKNTYKDRDPKSS